VICTNVGSVGRHRVAVPCVQLINKCTDDSTNTGANDLPPELSCRRRTKKVACLEVLHQLAGLEGSLTMSGSSR
jgi:hypothetical protein